jgi:DNA-binding transcriptional LysR family regulator
LGVRTSRIDECPEIGERTPAQMGPDLHKLEHFVAVAEDLNFTRAANRLHMAQQALSASIRRLEQELGVQLFVRSTRQVELTPAGRQLLIEGRGLLAASLTTWESVRRIDRGQRWLIRAGHTASVPPDHVEEILAAWRIREPGAALSVSRLSPGSLGAQVAEGVLDIGLCRVLEPPAGVTLTRLGDRPLRIAVAAEHRFARRDWVAMAELARERIVADEARDFVVELSRRAGFEPRVASSAVAGVPPLAAVAGTSDVALVDAPAGAAAGGRVVVRDLVPAPAMPVHAITRRGVALPVVAELVAAAAAGTGAAAELGENGNGALPARRLTPA